MSGDLLPDWEGQVLHLTSAESTQDVARDMAREGCPEWTLVVADRQTHGRGRLGRKWTSGKGGLYFSVVLHPNVPPAALAHLSLTTASAVAKALSSVSGLRMAVKPPNDVLAAPAATAAPQPGALIDAPPPADTLKKVCGILAEASGSSTKTDWVVLGIGVNVNNPTPKSIPQAGSLAALAGREFDLPEALRAILKEFRHGYAQFLQAYRQDLS